MERGAQETAPEDQERSVLLGVVADQGHAAGNQCQFGTDGLQQGVENCRRLQLPSADQRSYREEDDTENDISELPFPLAAWDSQTHFAANIMNHLMRIFPSKR